MCRYLCLDLLCLAVTITCDCYSITLFGRWRRFLLFSKVFVLLLFANVLLTAWAFLSSRYKKACRKLSLVTAIASCQFYGGGKWKTRSNSFEFRGRSWRTVAAVVPRSLSLHFRFRHRNVTCIYCWLISHSSSLRSKFLVNLLPWSLYPLNSDHMWHSLSSGWTWRCCVQQS